MESRVEAPLTRDEGADLRGYLQAVRLMSALAEHYDLACREVEERWQTLRWLAKATRGEARERREKTLLAMGMALARLGGSGSSA